MAEPRVLLMLRGGRVAVVGLALLAAPTLGSGARAPRLVVEPVVLEGEEAFQGNVLIASADGRELLAVDTRAGSLYRFHETATELGKPMPMPEVATLHARSLATDGSHIAVAGVQSIAVFSDRGDLLAKAPLFMAADIEPDGVGSWLVSVTNIPKGPGGGYLGRPEGDDSPPRIVRLDSDLEIDSEGFRSEPDLSASQAAGRELQLSRSNRSIYAVELSRYRIVELNRRLEVRAELAEPALALDEPDDESGIEASREAVQKGAERQVEPRGRTLAGGNAGKPAGPPVGVAVGHKPLVRASTYDRQMGKLLLLLDAAAGLGGPTLDVVDSDTGEVQRFSLPELGEIPNQIVAGRKYIWLRARSPQAVFYRIPRLPLLDGGLRLTLPENTRYPDADDGEQDPS